MADSSDSQGSLATESEHALARQQIDEVKADLEGWRETLLHLRGFLVWEQPYYPAAIFGVTTLLFALIWYFEPSVITTFALMGLVITGVDFAVPFVGPRLFYNRQWTGREEREFEQICERILHFRTHFSDFFHGMAILKEEKPKIYFLLVMGVLFFFAWIGYIMNNLFLTYFIVLTILMIPGLREKGLLQKYLLKYWLIFKRMLFGRIHAFKTKSK